MNYQCVWCGSAIEEEVNGATMDTCEACEDFFEDATETIADVLNALLKENEASEPKTDTENTEAAWRSYSLASAVQIFGGRPTPLFKDSKFLSFLPKES